MKSLVVLCDYMHMHVYIGLTRTHADLIWLNANIISYGHLPFNH